MRISIGIEPNLSNGAAALTAEMNEESFIPNKAVTPNKTTASAKTTMLIKKRFLPSSKTLMTLMTKIIIGTNKNK